MSSEKSQRHIATRIKPVALASVALCSALAAQAQEANQSLDTVVVTGIRKSLETTLNLKRTATGLVDGIVAEDIGKFPDTNLAESMQRIAGVSIDRNNSGEGSRITVRGVGPEFNLALLNGRQMPTSGAGGARAFDYANLSPDAIAALEVYKTARASSPTGGIGATVNVKTTRPLDQRGGIASIGVKANYDQSLSRLPSEIKGSSITPEISGIYSDSFADRTIGIAINASYSKRSSGSNTANTDNGWQSQPVSGNTAFTGVPASNLVNYPTSGFVTHTNDVRYKVTNLDRERLNGQAVLQFAPTKELKFTLDHTMAVNKVDSRAVENSAWFGPSFSGALKGSPPTTFVRTGEVSDPIIQTATWDGTHDYGMNVQQFATKTKLNSTGFNMAWKATDAISVDFDYHSSQSKTSPNSKYGDFNVIDLALFTQGNTTMYYDQKFPVMTSDLKYDSNKTTVTGSQFTNNMTDQKADQAQLKGTYKLSAEDKLMVGLGFTKLKNHVAGSNHFNGDWSGVGPQGSFKGVNVAIYNLPSFFSRMSGSGDSRQFQQFFVPDFEAVRAQAVKNAQSYRPQSAGAGGPLTAAEAEAYFAPYTDYKNGNDWYTNEKSTSAYGQWDHAFDTELPMNLSLGVRYESTKVTSSSQVTSYTGTSWYAENEIQLTGANQTFGTKNGKYSYVLPNLDFDVDLASNFKVRASLGVNIARPNFGDMLGGVALNANSARYNVNGAGSTGDPALKPLKSKNLDLSAEYYYTKGSYVAAGVFYKKVTDFFSTRIVENTYAGLGNPVSGTYYNAARAAGIPADAPKLLRNYILSNYNGQPGVKITDSSDPTFLKGTIDGTVPGATPLIFDITTPSNAGGDTIKGLELNFTHLIGTTGFGVSGNYTYVTSGLKFNNNSASNSPQSALLGISNSANLVGFYENDEWSIRGAYNWRGQFLSATGTDPVYTEPYAQVDVGIGYKFGKNLTLTADFLNLNDGVIRRHARSENEVVSNMQTGRRVLVGARYRF